MTADAKEAAFQQDVIDQMLACGWVLGDPAKYDRDNALYSEDCLASVATTQTKVWEKYKTLYPTDPKGAFIKTLAAQLKILRPRTNTCARLARWACCATSCGTNRAPSSFASSSLTMA